MKRITGAIIFAGVLSLGAATAVAQDAGNGHSGTKSEQEACTPDVYKFCEAAIPDEKRIVACLKANVWKLSAACRKVFRRR